MLRFLHALAYAIEPPLRFLLTGCFSLLAVLLGFLRVEPSTALPWPGRLAYHDPSLGSLLLGFLIVGSWIPSGWVRRPDGWVGGAILPFLGLAGAAVVESLIPEAGLPRLGAYLLLGGMATSRWSHHRSIGDLARSVGFVVLGLVGLKFILLDQLVAADGSAWTTSFRVLSLGSMTQPPLGPYEEPRVFFVLALFAAAVLAQAPEAVRRGPSHVEALPLGKNRDADRALEAEPTPLALPEAPEQPGASKPRAAD